MTRPPRRGALEVAAVGVVFGDIGTSPLYALQAALALRGRSSGRPTEGEVLGIVSLIVWSLTLVVTVKYVGLVLRADHRGEGGVLALAIRLRRSSRNRTLVLCVTGAGLLGLSLFLGDGVITPAISVLAAVEGLSVADPALSPYVALLAVVVIVLLFAGQRWGTQHVGSVFGPVMTVWFVLLAVIALPHLAQQPRALTALSPLAAGSFVMDQPAAAFVALGAVVLSVTGAEALYADLGHFGARPISRAWFLLVYPSLVLTYLGQGALVLGEPGATGNPFFLAVPGVGRPPDGGPGHGRDGHRLSGGHLGGVQRRAPSLSPGLPAQATHRAHREQPRPDLHPCSQRRAASGRARSGSGFRVLRRPRRCLRDRGDLDVPHHDHAPADACARVVAMALGCCRRGRVDDRHRGGALRRGQCPEAP